MWEHVQPMLCIFAFFRCTSLLLVFRMTHQWKWYFIIFSGALVDVYEDVFQLMVYYVNGYQIVSTNLNAIFLQALRTIIFPAIDPYIACRAIEKIKIIKTLDLSAPICAIINEYLILNVTAKITPKCHRKNKCHQPDTTMQYYVKSTYVLYTTYGWLRTFRARNQVSCYLTGVAHLLE